MNNDDLVKVFDVAGFKYFDFSAIGLTFVIV